MITVRHYEELGKVDHGWLTARHHFNFGSYYDPKRNGFGSLLVINDDIIQPGKGFNFHPHEDIEIITYVREGAITHHDNKENKDRTIAGDVQVMSAGTGILHAESNLEDVVTNLYQIWIKPKKRGYSPSWETKPFPNSTTTKQLSLLVSGYRSAPLGINQDAKIYVGRPKGRT